MEKLTKDEFKSAVMTAFEEKGYTKTKISMALFGMQCGVTYHQEGFPFKQEAHGSLREKGGKRYLHIEQKNGVEWDWEIPEQ